MQFYIVDPYPMDNAAMLPDYAIKSVNVREGWQILSDIGHRFGVHWEGQNKCYNKHHPLTRSFSHREAFKAFHQHYRACLSEYIRRKFGKATHWHAHWPFVPVAVIYDRLPETQYEETKHYLLTTKASHLSEADRLVMGEPFPPLTENEKEARKVGHLK